MEVINFSKVNILVTGAVLLFNSACAPSNSDMNLETDWEFHTQRTEIAPRHWVEDKVKYQGNQTLALSGDGKRYASGSWRCSYEVTAGKYYNFFTCFKPVNITQIDKTAFVEITWLGKEGNRVGFYEFPDFMAQQSDDSWYMLKQTYQVPQDAVKARVDLIYRWDAKGTVYFGGMTLKEVPPPEPRNVRMATVYHRPAHTGSPRESLEEFAEYVDLAGEEGADIVCLPEGVTIIGTGKSYLDVSEPVPGPSSEFLGELAKKHNMYIIAGIYEKEGPALYCTAILLGRDGELVGKYRKVSIPTEEFHGGITPGNSVSSVFDTDFGRIGIMICIDVFFPEVTRMLALQGAEVIFMPIWGGNLSLFEARTIENQIYLVTSSYDSETGIFDKTGELIIEANEENPVAMVEVDLNSRHLWYWLGEFRNRIVREMPGPELTK
jgi:predicted amidohydrolase